MSAKTVSEICKETNVQQCHLCEDLDCRNNMSIEKILESLKHKIKVSSMEHLDQNESDGNAATKYIVRFTGKVNCDWLWRVLDEALREAQK